MYVSKEEADAKLLLLISIMGELTNMYECPKLFFFCEKKHPPFQFFPKGMLAFVDICV